MTTARAMNCKFRRCEYTTWKVTSASSAYGITFQVVRGSVSDLNFSKPSRRRSRRRVANQLLRFLRGGFGSFRRRRRYSDVVGHFFGAAACSRLCRAVFGASVFGFAGQRRLKAGDRRRAARDGLVSGELIVDAFLDVGVRFRRFRRSRRFFRLAVRLLLRLSLRQSEYCHKQKRKGQGNHFPHGLFSYGLRLLFHLWVWDRLLQLNCYSAARGVVSLSRRRVSNRCAI